MAKKVLSVGQCGPDNSTLWRYLDTHFDAEFATADLPADAMAKLRAQPFDLVLINRKLDADYSDGLEILKSIKADEKLKDTPTMLVTNHPEYHEQAVALGGVYGFGKLEYNKPATLECLTKFLGPAKS